jgi:hypothetical protein
VRRLWLVSGFILLQACSDRKAAPPVDADSAAPAVISESADTAMLVRELIPAEWTVAEDTSVTGDVTTVSLQLPAARNISGLLPEEDSRILLRCIDGLIEASIEVDGPGAQPVTVQLDSAPSCE